MKLLTAGLAVAGAWLVIEALFPSNARAETSVPPTPDTPDGYLDRKYDQIFMTECSSIPVEYLRALAKKESDFNPLSAKPGQGVGLLQVTYTVLADYNKLYGTSYVSDDRLDPTINARIACELISRIANFLPSYAPRAFTGGRFNWSSRRDIKILTLAWNAGWSSRGVAGILRHLLADGYSISQITAESIHRNAYKYSNIDEIFSEGVDRRISWLNSVADYYFHELRAVVS